MAAIGDSHRTPRAVIHKRILDLAGERPEASMAEIAESIGGASTDLVERVLAEYGDPAEADSAADVAGAGADGRVDSNGGNDATMATEPSTEGDGAETAAAADGAANQGDTESAGPVEEVERDGLTDKQLEVLRAIHEHPDAPQRELGELLDVSASTVSTRLSEVPGFEWEDRWAFVSRLFDGATDGGQLAKADEDLRERVDELEARVEALGANASTAGGTGAPFEPELAHKVVHACIESERLSEEEELEVLRGLMAGTPGAGTDQ